MDAELTAVVAGVLGLLTGSLAVAAFWYSDRVLRGPRRAASTTGPEPVVPEEVVRVLSVLPGATFVVAPDGSVLYASASAVSLGVVQGDRVAVPAVAALTGQVRRDGVIRELDLELPRPPLRTTLVQVRVRVAPLPSETTLVLVEDVSDALRVDAVRRDFVANVSHELKTPVGALSLLAEAIESAGDEPEQVRRFAARMQGETQRLTNLVNDLIDLSRLQGAGEPPPQRPVPVARIVGEALEGTRMVAQARDIEVVAPVDVPSVCVAGDEGQLATALRNLITNALAYSPARTRVAVSCRVVPAGAESVVEIAVTDQGIGIPAAEQTRIFERFYRVDPARSRVTGGTGLGLAIVKHVCANHGGECTVWSVPGEGSTFTLRLPVLAESAAVQDPAAGRPTPRRTEPVSTRSTRARADTREKVQ